jgi:hypothetical protein
VPVLGCGSIAAGVWWGDLLPITVTVGAIKHPDPNDQDAIDKGIEAGKQYDIKSKSARDFYDGLKKLHDACIEKKGMPACCCIEHLILDGHSTAGLGGEEALRVLSESEIADIKSWLCAGATITVYGCFAFSTAKRYSLYRLHFDLAMLLAEKGGTYEGFKSTTTGLVPDVVSSDPDEKKTTKLPIPEGATRDDVRKGFKKNDPKGN